MDWTWLSEAGVASGALAVLAFSISRMFAYLEKRDEREDDEE